MDPICGWSPDYCLSCDRQTDGSCYCSQACRLADMEKARMPTLQSWSNYPWTRPQMLSSQFPSFSDLKKPTFGLNMVPPLAHSPSQSSASSTSTLRTGLYLPPTPTSMSLKEVDPKRSKVRHMQSTAIPPKIKLAERASPRPVDKESKSIQPSHSIVFIEYFKCLDKLIKENYSKHSPKPSRNEEDHRIDKEGMLKSCTESPKVCVAEHPRMGTPWSAAKSSVDTDSQAAENSDSDWWGDTCSCSSSSAPASNAKFLQCAEDAAKVLFNEFSREKNSTIQTAGESHSSSRSSAASDPSRVGTSSSASSIQSTRKPSEGLSNNPRRRSPDDDDDHNRRPRQRRRVDLISNAELLACPFAKNQPMRHSKCFRYMIQEIARLKQHILRVHQNPIHCARCFQVFSTEGERDVHAREVPVCSVQPTRTWDGVSETQRRQLGKRVSSKKSKEENWYIIYSILFPNATRPKSPFIDNVQLSEELTALREFTMQQAPTRISTFALTEMPEELRSSQDQVEAFTQAAVRDLFDMVIERWSSREQEQISYGPSATSDLNSDFEVRGSSESNSTSLRSPDKDTNGKESLSEQDYLFGASDDTEFFLDLTSCELETTDNSTLALDWFSPLKNHEFLS